MTAVSAINVFFMGLTFLMEQRTAGKRSVAAKVPYFAEMINERDRLFLRRRGVRLGFIAVQKARFPTAFEEDSGMSGMPIYLVALGGMAVMFYWVIARTYNISAWPSGSSRDSDRYRDRNDDSYGSSSGGGSSGSSIANLFSSDNSSSNCSSDNSTPTDNSSSNCSSDSFSSSDDSSSSSDSSSDDSGGGDSDSGSDSDSGGSSDD
ncbi:MULTISPECIES: hypothetical protein [unclassified Bradyrhizobium]|uniref:hypothetical protein n=1 Tax=unclassified Bradyrhizobium TaxID=2631580 RepID=UPI001BA9AF69|nr:MULTISPECIES: hypothetical protein [unclassified Bradyrhizobium]MBR1228298.1 hypothetical protein [Bradyrhizobium sp. AUGA SZCCT0176]MBR1284925.1 hypothetical protein [Bradyrhizobium sp. AUGA SZCCT0177]MBR1299354.1 hypothetical protein [Bradyrhizobium sp. AUGA SZCCT0042]